jgi:hypothetical protein
VKKNDSLKGFMQLMPFYILKLSVRPNTMPWGTAFCCIWKPRRTKTKEKEKETLLLSGNEEWGNEEAGVVGLVPFKVEFLWSQRHHSVCSHPLAFSYSLSLLFHSQFRGHFSSLDNVHTILPLPRSPHNQG